MRICTSFFARQMITSLRFRADNGNLKITYLVRTDLISATLLAYVDKAFRIDADDVGMSRPPSRQYIDLSDEHAQGALSTTFLGVS